MDLISNQNIYEKIDKKLKVSIIEEKLSFPCEN